MGQKEDEICPQYVVKSVSFESRPLGVRKESRNDILSLWNAV